MRIRTRAIRRALLGCAAGAVATALLGAAAPAAAQPAGASSRPLRLLTPGGAGSALDLQARALAEALAAPLGRPVVVEGRPGAGGTIAVDEVLRAEPDGSTALATIDGPLTVLPSIFPDRARYRPTRDLVAAAVLARGGCQVLVVHPSVPARTLPEFVDWARRQPDGVQYASTGNGSPTHVVAEELRAATGLDLRHVPYRTGQPALLDLIAGRIPMMLPPVGLVRPALADGRVRAIAVAPGRRCASLPEVPTAAEQGVAGFDAGRVWFGVLVPARTPPDVVARLNDALREAAASPRFVQAMTQQDLDVAPLSVVDSRSAFERSVEETAKRLGALGVRWE